MRLYFKLNEDKSYEKCNYKTWAKQFKSIDRFVAEDEICSCIVSTIWIGHNYNYFDKPLFFETMIYSPDGNSIERGRYNTWEEALIGHIEAFKWVEAWLNPANDGSKFIIRYVEQKGQ